VFDAESALSARVWLTGAAFWRGSATQIAATVAAVAIGTSHCSRHRRHSGSVVVAGGAVRANVASNC
jgi:hypothetical protein